MKATFSDPSGVNLSESVTAMGLNGGMGFQFHLAGVRTFAEARYQYIFSKNDNKGFENASGIPITIGFRF